MCVIESMLDVPLMSTAVSKVDSLVIGMTSDVRTAPKRPLLRAIV
jgi:hypothetical protein